MLFAQRGGFAAGGGGGGGGGGSEVAAMIFMGAYFLFIIAVLVITILFLIAQYKALSACSPRNRTMEPSHVFFVFIPIAGIVFAIMALFKIPDSLEQEFRSRGIRMGGEDFGKNLAIWYLVTCFVCPIVPPILAIILMTKWNKLTLQLTSGAGRGSRGDDFEDEYDDRGRGRGRDDDDDRDDDYRPRRRD